MTENQRANLLVVVVQPLSAKATASQEIMRWELQERNELTETLARRREEQSAKLFEEFAGPENIDVRALASLLAADRPTSSCGRKRPTFTRTLSQLGRGLVAD